MIKNIGCILLTLSLIPALGQAQENKSVIIKDAEALAADPSYKVESIFPSLGLYKVESRGLKQGTTLSATNLKKKLFLTGRKAPVLFKDHILTLRASEVRPSDSSFKDQWGLNGEFGIKAPQAWSKGTGGTDANGNEIVIAVVDGGFESSHRDLLDNLWVNKEEIPDNGIDDDNNGHVDDINGWDVTYSKGKLQVASHGTHVAGIMGAKGDNQDQVTGVNWNVKIMMVSSGGRTLAKTSYTLKAYNYILEQKKLWLETNGKRGANVVAINSSFGINFGNCNSSEYTLWNDVYNELGKVGILSAAATANMNVDVDVKGDVPTGCSSPYIVAVTNSDKSGNRNRGAAYGKTTIDLAAPGTSILSTVPGNRISNKTGTSMATPHVTGAIGFLYSVASKDFLAASLKDPASAALEVKRIMMETVNKRSAFEKTVSGGILDLAAASDVISSYKSDNTGTEPDDSQDDDTDSDQEEPADNTDSDEPVEDPSEEPTVEEPTVEEPATSTKLFTQSTAQKIPDAFFFDGVLESTLHIDKNLDASQTVGVAFTIAHAQHSDLKVYLVAPNGKRIQLLNNPKGQQAQTDYTFKPLDFGEQKAGTWKLIIRDTSTFDSGKLLSWSLKL